jgi:YD repeat-containing protein
LLGCAWLISAPRALAQPPSIFYVYDDLNRLIAVIDAQGNAATYTYDASGNLLRVDRFDASQQPPGPVRITLVTPSKGKVGTPVQIFGTGFSATASQDLVTFSGAGATVTAAVPNRILTTVPSSAATGTITVATPLGSATSATAFQVIGPVTVTPTTATVTVTRTVQFQAQEGGTATTNVTWSVNGLPGGDTTVGTISTDGLYTAPARVPNPATVTVTATDKDDPTDSASASVTIMPPQPVFLASRAVSVGVAEARTVNQNVTATVSVAVGETSTPLAAAGLVSVQVAESAAAFAAAAPTAVAIAPVVTAVTPVSGARGATLTLTLSGSGFGGATGVTLLLNNATDTTITAANLAVNTDGTQATVDITIAAGAALGARVVQITTPGGNSTAAGTGGNLFTVQ